MHFTNVGCERNPQQAMHVLQARPVSDVVVDGVSHGSLQANGNPGKGCGDATFRNYTKR